MTTITPTPELVALLACPFCGGDQIQVEAHGYGHYGINCNAAEGGCGAESGHFQSPSEATKWWNTRALSVPSGLELEYGGDDSEAGGAVACDIGDYGALDSREWATVLFNDRKFAECYHDEDARLVADALNFYRDHYAAATRAATVPQGVWLPIESAPKDGKVVDLYGNGRRICDCFFEAVTTKGWRKVRVSTNNTWRIDNFTPTHWQPLPTPPPAELGNDDGR